MRKTLVLIGTLLLTTAAAQQHDEPVPKRTIYGVVIGQDGLPAKRIGLTAWPLGGPLGTRLPHTTTSDTGEYRFENLPWWGRYSVQADDDSAGYSIFSSDESRNDPPEVELTPEHPEAEMRVFLPPKAGFLHIRLTNRRTGAGISGMWVALALMESPEQRVYSISCSSNQVVLIAPDKNLLLHVGSDGYHEWDESAGHGRALHLASGATLTLDIKLDPLN